MNKVQILVVESESVVAADTQKTLQNLGYDVPSVACSGEAAIRKTQENKPDLVLMDIGLKGQMDGIEAAEQIRSRFNIPIVYLMGYVDDKTLERVKVTEPIGYIIRPFEARKLKIAMEMAIYKTKIRDKFFRRITKYISDIQRRLYDLQRGI